MIKVQEFYDKNTATLSYVVWDERSRDAVIIDPVLDYDAPSSKTSTESIDLLKKFINDNHLQLVAILETHAHADHLSGSQNLKMDFPRAVLAIGARITEVQKTFKDIFGLPAEFKTDGSQFDRLLNNNEDFQAGSIKVKTLFTPGHTPACVSYLIHDCLFVGDALFMPDYGTGRCDFPSGSAAELYQSIHERIYSLPPLTKIFTGHDYLPNGRALKFMSTVAEEKKSNIQLSEKTSFDDFVRFRVERDRTLSTPKLLLPSVQINIDAGHLPPKDQNGNRYLKIPIK